MSKDNLFIVIEGLDGSGKTTVGRQLALFLQTIYPKKVKLTFEPHDPSTGGLFIRQILEKKITNFSHRTLALSFAANRMDHNYRQINNWLDEGDQKIVICDRYYLSSLVYQSTEETPMEEVLDLNRMARKPDLFFFFNVSNEVCFQRMKHRNKPQELFEKDLSETRDKYLKAIHLLETTRSEIIHEIDANGTMESALQQMVHIIHKTVKGWDNPQLLEVENFKISLPDTLKRKESGTITRKEILAHLSADQQNRTQLKVLLEGFSFPEKGALFLDYLTSLGYEISDQLLWANAEAYAMSFNLPGGLEQRGAALLIEEAQHYTDILGTAANLNSMSDFMFVFSPGDSAAVANYYEREVINYSDGLPSLNPSTKLVTEDVLLDYLAKI